MTDHMEGARLKIQRAWEHLGSVDAETAAFFNMHPYSVAAEQDGEDSWRVFINVRQQIPPHLALGFGDAVHNIRSALDHLAQALTRSSSNRKVQWPICDTLSAWNSGHKRNLNGIDAVFHTEIRSRQPFADPSKYGGLTVLRELDDADKHRVLQLASPWPSEAQVTIPPGLSVTEHATGPLNVEQGAVLFRMAGKPVAPDMNMQVKATVGYRVAFGTGPYSTNTRALLEISYTVLAIIDSFAPLLS